MTGQISFFDDRASFATAEAVLAIIRDRCEKYPDDRAVWGSFIKWRGEGEAEYLERIHAGRKFIFYSLLHDLYNFAEEACGEDITAAAGRYLAEELLRRHMPDILQAITVKTGSLSEQVVWFLRQVLSGTAGEIYELGVNLRPEEKIVSLLVTWRLENEMVDYLKRSGHNPQQAFANSFGVIVGVTKSLLVRILCDFSPTQLGSELRGLRGQLVLSLKDKNRFNFEQMTEILLDYVMRLRQQMKSAEEPMTAEAALCTSEAMRSAWERICKASASDETVLLCGESGTGKSYYARVVHQLSSRRDGPFVGVGLTSDVGSDNLVQSNLFGHVRGAFTGATEEKHGLFALADGGTIFLDEVGDASAELQAKLLRVLDNKSFKMLGGLADMEVNVRIIAATNRNLSQMVREGRFREDLYYRLNVIQVELPPLRQRTEDIPALVKRLFERVCRDARKQEKRLSDEALGLLCRCSWPGNIREVENALRHAVAFSEKAQIGAEDLPQAALVVTVPHKPAARASRESGPVIDRDALVQIISTVPPAPGLPSFEWQGHVDYAKREYLKALIECYNGNLSKIARHWDRSSERTLLKLIREFRLEDELQAARRKGK